MANTLTDFKKALNMGGARPNLFEVVIPDFPGNDSIAKGDGAADFNMLVKGAQLPESTVGLVEVPFRGRTFKVAGDRTFAPWSITVINDVDFKIRTAMETWAQTVAQYADGSGATNPGDYMRPATVTQLKRGKSETGGVDGSGLSRSKSYNFFDIWPTSISAIDLSYDSSDVIEEFTVEFQVNYWAPAEISGGPLN
tara:strand:- start:271 stop:858 length:588 start_codon:yes stop_codon:yes gene_type:complete